MQSGKCPWIAPVHLRRKVEQEEGERFIAEDGGGRTATRMSEDRKAASEDRIAAREVKTESQQEKRRQDRSKRSEDRSTARKSIAVSESA